MDAIITELVRQASLNDHSAYNRESVEQAVRTMADVGSPSTVDSYVRQIGQTDAIRVEAGKFHITEEAFERYEEVHG